MSEHRQQRIGREAVTPMAVLLLALLAGCGTSEPTAVPPTPTAEAPPAKLEIVDTAIDHVGTFNNEKDVEVVVANVGGLPATNVHVLAVAYVDKQGTEIGGEYRKVVLPFTIEPGQAGKVQLHIDAVPCTFGTCSAARVDVEIEGLPETHTIVWEG